MRPIIFLLFAFFTLVIILISYLNVSNIISIEIGSNVVKASVGLLTFSSAVFGSFATFFLLALRQSININSEKAFKRKIEDVKLKNEIESDRVMQLEAKIKTLEKALESLAS